MLKYLSLFVMLFNSGFYNDISTKIEKIEYSKKDYVNNILHLNISVQAPKKDILELIIDFYDENNMKIGNTFSSAIIVQGRKKTIAKIPVEVKKTMQMKIVIEGNNEKRELLNIVIPLYRYTEENCNLSEKGFCESKYPSKIMYLNGELQEIYEKIFLINDVLEFHSLDNYIPLNKINIIGQYEINDDRGELKIEKEIEEMHLYFYEGYSFPIKLDIKDGKLQFDFENSYYIDKMKGEMYEEYYVNTIYDNKVLLPYKQAEYYLNIKLENCFLYFDNVEIDFLVYTSNILIGDCKNSLYCFRRIYI